jgi:hypothetical protein
MMGKYHHGLRRVVPVGKLHWSSLRLHARQVGGALFTPPSSVDLLSGLPTKWLGMMGNDGCGDCLEAMFYHGDQIRTFYASGTMLTEPDANVVNLYSQITGYNPADVKSDIGSDPQQSFNWIENYGLVRADGSNTKLIAYIEIDPRNESDVLEAMDICGGLSVGINFPQSVDDDMDAPIWDYNPARSKIIGGHEILVAKHTAGGNYGFVSWGQTNFEMTPAFWDQYVNQCTACVWEDWFEQTGKSPFGLSVPAMETILDSMKHGTTG